MMIACGESLSGMYIEFGSISGVGCGGGRGAGARCELECSSDLYLQVKNNPSRAYGYLHAFSSEDRQL